MTPCIEWQQAKDEKGYGYKWFQGKVVRAHRLEYCLHHQVSLSSIQGLVIRHKCDNPSCINPEHLETGSHADNVKDREDRGRGRQPTGERNAAHKLTDIQVEEIKSLFTGARGEYAEFGRRYGVSPQAIRFHVRKKK